MADIKISDMVAASTLDGTELLEVVQTGTNKKMTVSTLAAKVEDLGQFVQVVGDGVNVNITVTHNLATKNLHVTVRRNGTPWEQILCDNECPTDNTTTLKFGAIAPGVDAFKVTISK